MSQSGGPLVYAPAGRAQLARALLGAACAATRAPIRIEHLASGPLYRRLRDEAGAPRADLVLAANPYLADLAARDGLAAPLRPRAWPPDGFRHLRLADHHADWRWAAVGYLPWLALGAAADTFARLLEPGGPPLAILDPATTEQGMTLVLAVLDRARQAEGDAERGWEWWERCASLGLRVHEDETSLLAAAGAGGSVALLLGPAPDAPAAVPLQGLSPVPLTLSLLASAPRADAARHVAEWLLGPDAASAVAQAGVLSHWRAEQDGLARLGRQVPALDVEWTFDHYREARAEWGRKFGRRLLAR